MDLPNITRQQQMYVDACLRGVTDTEASRVAGYASAAGSRLRKIPAVSEALQSGYKETRIRRNLGVDDVIDGLMDAVRSSDGAMDLVAAWREIGRIVGAYDRERVIEVRHRHEVELVRNNADALRNLPTADLMRLADMEDIIDGEYAEVVDGDGKKD